MPILPKNWIGRAEYPIRNLTVSRSSKTRNVRDNLYFDTPAVRDRYGNRKEISDVRIVTSSVKVGRFWWER